MKNVKKLLALLLAMVMLFALCACTITMDEKDEKKGKSESLTEADLEGDWTMAIDFGALADSGVMGDAPELFDMIDPDELDLTMKMDVTFEDGVMEADPDSVAECFEDMLDSMLDWMKKDDNIYELMAMSDGDMTADEFKALCEEQGITKNDLMDAIEAEMPEADEMFGDAANEFGFCYELDGNKLYTWDEDDEKDEENYFQFTYADDTITVTKVSDDGETIKLDDGDFVFEKK